MYNVVLTLLLKTIASGNAPCRRDGPPALPSVALTKQGRYVPEKLESGHSCSSYKTTSVAAMAVTITGLGDI